MLLPPTNLSEGLLSSPSANPPHVGGDPIDHHMRDASRGATFGIAKLLIPSGAFDQASGGEILSPTQIGLLCLSLHAFFVAKVPLS